jgi:hypothetical protein
VDLMLNVAMALLDTTGAALDPAVSVTGRLTVAQKPEAWEMPEAMDPGALPSHRFCCRAGSGLAPLRQLEAADGRKFRIMGRADTTVGPPNVEYWLLKVT